MMRQKWIQLHPSQWPGVNRFIDEDGVKHELIANDCAECWQHRLGYYLIRKKSVKSMPPYSRKRWLLISPENGELLGDWTFRSTKKKPPITDANKILNT